MDRLKTSLIAVLVVFALSSAAARAGQGRGPGSLRILVDKTLTHLTDGIITREQVGEVAEAGFTVFVPRRGGENLEFLRKAAGWARENDLAFMPWMRGTLPPGDGPRTVWADGTVTPICSPTSDRLWDWMNENITAYARLSTEVPSVMGVFLDYEIYAHPKRGNAYSLSYDRAILEDFAAEEGVDLPELDPARRAPWLREKGLHEEFAEFQVARWRERCRRLRQKVDGINPRFRFCVYPAPGTPFIRKAIYAEWAAEKAPLILADACTYGRRAAIPHGQALQANRRVLAKRMASVKEAGIPFEYAGGLDPVVEGADPEFCGKSAVMISDVSDGYWVFYEGPMDERLQDRCSYFVPGPEDHRAYWQWFTWANRTIRRGNFDAQNEPRETPDTVGPTVGPLLEPVRKEGVRRPEEVFLGRRGTRLRGWGCCYILATRGRRIRLELRGHRLGDYRDVPTYLLFDPQGGRILEGELPLGKITETAFEPEQDGVYTLFVFSRSNTFSVAVGAAHWVVAPRGYPGDGAGLHVCQFARRLYFHVPPDTDEFAVRLTSPHGPGERIAARVLDPDGNVVAEKETAEATLTVKPPRRHRGQAWSIVLDEPEEGIFEDALIGVDGVPSLFAESPRALLTPRGE